MAIRTYTSKKNVTTYKVLFRHAGKQTSETFPTMRAAETFERKIKRLGPEAALRILAHRQGQLDDDVPTVAQQVQAHIDTLSHITPGTLNQYRAIHTKIAAADLGTLPIDMVTRADVAAWLKTMQDAGRRAPTIRNYQAILSAALGQAVDDELIPSNPATRHKIRRTERAGRTFLTYDQFGVLRDAASDHYKPFLTFMVSTGLRLGEAVALRVQDLSLDATPDATITVARAWKSGGGFGPPKTRKGERTLSLPAPTAKDLTRIIEGKEPEDLVFVNLNGDMILQSTLYDAWKFWRKKAGLPVTLRIHDLRHTHASWMLAQGVSLFDLQHRLGHESIKTTADTYGHLMPEASAVAARAAALALSRVPAAIEPSKGPAAIAS